jgi:glutamate racemase
VDHPVTEQVARIYLQEGFGDGFHEADVLVLGCTHYPLLHPLLRRVVPPGVAIVDTAHSTATAVAEEIQRIQQDRPDAVGESERRGTTRMKFFATDSVEKFRRLGPKFLGHPVEDVQHVDLKE